MSVSCVDILGLGIDVAGMSPTLGVGYGFRQRLNAAVDHVQELRGACAIRNLEVAVGSLRGVVVHLRGRGFLLVVLGARLVIGLGVIVASGIGRACLGVRQIVDGVALPRPSGCVDV